MILDIYSTIGIALLALVSIWMVHTRLAVYLSGAVTVLAIRVAMVVGGVVIGYIMTADMKADTVFILLTAMSWVGLAHLPVAMVLFIVEEKQQDIKT